MGGAPNDLLSEFSRDNPRGLGDAIPRGKLKHMGLTRTALVATSCLAITGCGGSTTPPRDNAGDASVNDVGSREDAPNGADGGALTCSAQTAAAAELVRGAAEEAQ